MAEVILKMDIDHSLLDRSMDLAQKIGANYADVRIETSVYESASAENGDIKDVSRGANTALGVRALAGGTWGFRSSDVSDELKIWDILEECVQSAVKTAKATSSFDSIELAEITPVKDKIPLSYNTPPIPLEEKKDLVVDITNNVYNFKDEIQLAIESLSHHDTTKYFASTEGAQIIEEFILIWGYSYVMAGANGNVQTIWIPYGTRGGWECIDKYNPLRSAQTIAKTAVDLVNKAITPKTQPTTVVTRPEFVSLKVHEIVGHPIEGDRILGGESAWAGRAWWKDKVGEKVGSELVNAVSDARPLPEHEGMYGTFKYDDEGVPSSRVVHIENGHLKEFLHSRQTAALFGVKPNGGMRAVSASMVPIIRMTNTYFEADPDGPKTEEELIEDIKEGVIFGHQSIPSIGSTRFQWQINAYEGWEIKNGERGRMLKNLSIMGNTLEYLNSIYRVGGPETFELRQIPNCGKGDPMQVMKLSNGGPLMLGKALVVGGV
jgi:TldD protein